MGLTKAIAAYEDCADIYDRAQASSDGIRVFIGTKGDAFYMRMRMNHYRVLQRDESRRIYERTDPQYGKSENDRFRIIMKDDEEGAWWIYVEPWNDIHYHIEELGNDDAGTTLSAAESES